VNPTQFNDPEDLRNYPRDLDRDLAMLRAEGVDAVLAPSEAELYADAYRYRVTEGERSKALCGAHRPGHFDGVLTVVLKLLSIAGADRAYFGEKDFQQLDLIRGMADAFFLDTKIVGCPIVRERDGLAMSSRNALLGVDDRARAPGLRRALASSPTPEAAREALERAGFQVDYVEDRETGFGLRRFGAARLGGVRLIDNVAR
jgi:pantoate--beta-alanine ligase